MTTIGFDQPSSHAITEGRSKPKCLAGPARSPRLRPQRSLKLRPRLMAHAICELQDAQVEPDVWKIEGLDRREDCENTVAVVRRGRRDKTGCIILGRGENDRKVREWLATAATVDGFIGFAVGRTGFGGPLVNLRGQNITRDAAVSETARRYREYVNIFENTRTEAAATVS